MCNDLDFHNCLIKIYVNAKEGAEPSCWFFREKQMLRCKGVNGKALLPNMRNIESSAPLNPATCMLRKVCSDQKFPGFPPGPRGESCNLHIAKVSPNQTYARLLP
jgi:hypothetical protein